MFMAPFLVVDPGSAGTIVLDRWGLVAPIVTAAAEARTLAQPTKAGLLATVVLDEDGGDLTLTVTGGYNADGDTTITFGDAGDFVTFVSVKVGASYYWRVAAQEGTNAAVEDLTVDQLTATSLTLNDTVVSADDMAEGAGFTGTGATIEHRVSKVGDLIKTEILIDLTGIRSTAADDIIGDDGTTDPCHIGQITAAVNGTIFAGRIACLEAPAGGDPDIDLYSAVEGTGSEDDAISGLTGTQLLNAGDHAADAFKSLTAYPAADEYLYLVAGATTDADYTAGILLIELWGK